MEYRDILHNPLDTGDFIIYAALWDRSATLKFGIITEKSSRVETYKGEIPTLKVITVDREIKFTENGHTHEWELQNKGRPITLSFLDRLMYMSMIDDELEVILRNAYHKYLLEKDKP